MSRLLVVLLLAAVAVSCVSAQKVTRCQVDGECKSAGKSIACRRGLCMQPCTYNSECASGDCEHEGLKWTGFCKLPRGSECLIDLTCESGKKCKHGYCVPKKSW